MTNGPFETRIQILERKNRVLTLCVAAVLSLAGLIVVLGQARPPDFFAASPPSPDGQFRIVYASKFVLQDPRTGLTRATLAHQVHEGGWAGLHFYDGRGEPRAWVQLFEDGEASVALLDSQRQFQALLKVDQNGQASFSTSKAEQWKPRPYTSK
jgi:hypothetical protein